MALNRIAIIGGGLTGCSLAAQLCDQAEKPLDITIIEPRSELGAGVAYSADDPDHRLNAPLFVHFLTPEKVEEFQNWFTEGGGLSRDPNALAADGNIYARRRELAHYVSETMAKYAENNPSKSTINHCQSTALEINPVETGFKIITSNEQELIVDKIVLATGNQAPSSPPPFDGELKNHSAYFKSPWDLDRIRSIHRQAAVLIIGTGLTMSDIVATLMRQGHEGKITAVSRRGMLPQEHAKPPENAPPRNPFNGIMADKPAHITGSLLQIFVDLRQRMQNNLRHGGAWQWAFDELRDCVWQIWPELSFVEKQRFLRHLRTWYDSHRFRLPPQTARIRDEALDKGILNFETAHITDAIGAENYLTVALTKENFPTPQKYKFKAVINCTGPRQNPAITPNAAYRSVLNNKLADVHATGLGFDVDDNCRAIQEDGSISENIFIVGPPTVGVFGDPIGIPFIVAQIHRMLPTFLASLD
ncbi:MAG: SidA/IucD/PvdA family monooxygenase [Rhodospirillaceae bacterium]|jgi:uncharacterized NAD(P)/FAD-binding protein YdhS|nr:SidA/IucD/PvdA family monooxygenase [Rhodospirillaceae bacterium]MBT4589400.1 SidA/IucD/PvdA family monooxygenase [Rhodospirillaceae bacterium]MBT4939565.1 SidA/IucD/PvdA family monooxygenase [Rhodospirillaceae bacterium]MBT5940630.1 SidA/IucD/PvdA family monooxygenase [Rhodospirillaceae bacterium]MBT7267308.1 SidA/IucD/PvdA family monooxygenase [Rhodospirillaceae bacterium]